MKMKKKFEKVYQFKVTLQDMKPPVWRRIQIPETCTFWDLHVAIQNAMGWSDSHLHEFEVLHPVTGTPVRFGIPNEDDDSGVVPDWEGRISDLLPKAGSKASYVYDFGDSWEHIVKLEKVLEKEKAIKYPRCVDGERACPPEDCGGPWGYVEFLEAIRNPKHEEHEDMLEWVGGKFDPEHFDAKEVRFIDPDKHRKDALG